MKALIFALLCKARSLHIAAFGARCSTGQTDPKSTHHHTPPQTRHVKAQDRHRLSAGWRYNLGSGRLMAAVSSHHSVGALASANRLPGGRTGGGGRPEGRYSAG